MKFGTKKKMGLIYVIRDSLNLYLISVFKHVGCKDFIHRG